MHTCIRTSVSDCDANKFTFSNANKIRVIVARTRFNHCLNFLWKFGESFIKHASDRIDIKHTVRDYERFCIL